MQALILMTLVIVGIISTLLLLSLGVRGLFMKLVHRRTPCIYMHSGWIDGHAEILSMKRTGRYIDALPELRMNVRIQELGGRSFVAEVCSAFSFLDILAIREGGKVPVKYNPKNPAEINIAGILHRTNPIHSTKSAIRYPNSTIH